MKELDSEFIYESMVKGIFTEYCDVVMSFVEESKYKRIQELGRTKAHSQKKRCKDGLKTLETVGEKELFGLGCYEELKFNLLRQLYRMLGETSDYKKAEMFLTEKVDEEKMNFKIWLRGE